MTDAASEPRLRVVGVADTDSYVKWAGALLGAAPAHWEVSLLVLDTPVAVSEGQLRAAVAGSGLDASAVARVGFDELPGALAGADAVLVAARGPLVRVLARAAAELDPRPVIVSGLPGISIPATRKAALYRAQTDLFVLHSLREVREFGELSQRIGMPHRYALATLPFAAHARDESATATGIGGTDLVFAAQAKVPHDREDRIRLARLLVRAAEAQPDRRVVVKLRGVKGERQTHDEDDPFPDLLAELGPLPENLVFSTAPMAVALDTAEGLLTVSSTAAIEAVARRIPVIALDTFGVSEELINPVFEDSGLLAGEADVVARRFLHASAEWLYENYLHDRSEDDWAAQLAELVRLRRAGELPPRPPLARRGGALRDAWERKRVLGPLDHTASGRVALVIGTPVRAAVRVAEAMRRPSA